jgi:hypothetical protein
MRITDRDDAVRILVDHGALVRPLDWNIAPLHREVFGTLDRASPIDPTSQVDPPWGHFTSEFIWFHRPLAAYWKAFGRAGLRVTDFDEPRVQPARYHLAPSEKKLSASRQRPYSVAFQLERA